MSTRTPSHYKGRRIGLNSKHKGTGFKGKAEPEGTLANPHRNSLAARIHRGDQKLLKDLGLTQAEANERLRTYLKNARITDELMSRWYRNNVQVKEPQGDTS